MRGYLLVRAPNRPTRQVLVSKVPFSIGRDRRNDLVLDDDWVSRQHALLDVAEGVLQIADIGSRNGTAINGTTLRFPTPLHDGDMVQMGHCSLWYSADPPTGMSPTPVHDDDTDLNLGATYW